MSDENIKENFNVSVVIPLYNAELYLKQSVESALAQSEVKEVILVDDGSPDKSLEVCKSLAAADARVKYFTHRNNINLGPAATRNLGIKQGTQPFVAFLDADDFYLPNRFSITKILFAKDPTIDGVYEAIGAHFESDEAKKRWQQMSMSDLTTIRPGIAPENLFYEQSPVGQAGHCSLDGLTLRKNIFKKVGFFDITLRGGEDSAFFIKLAAMLKLMPGQVTSPVAMRRVHASNAFTQLKSPHKNWRYRIGMWLSVYDWLRSESQDLNKQETIIQKILYDLDKTNKNMKITFKQIPSLIYRAAFILYHQPGLILNKKYLIGIGKRFFRIC